MVWILIALLVIFLLLLGYLLFAPFYIEVNSVVGRYCIRFHKIARVNFYINEEEFTLDYKIIRWGGKVNLLSDNSDKNKLSETSANIEKSSSRIIKKESRKIPLKKIHAVINSFKVNKFHISISFENMALNGIFYPFFELMSFKSGKLFHINFWDENKIIIEAENTFYRMIRAYIKS